MSFFNLSKEFDHTYTIASSLCDFCVVPFCFILILITILSIILSYYEKYKIIGSLLYNYLLKPLHLDSEELIQ
jgi:hypothetical protein